MSKVREVEDRREEESTEVGDVRSVTSVMVHE
jgi:hypothetical protein